MYNSNLAEIKETERKILFEGVEVGTVLDLFLKGPAGMSFYFKHKSGKSLESTLPLNAKILQIKKRHPFATTKFKIIIEG